MQPSGARISNIPGRPHPPDPSHAPRDHRGPDGRECRQVRGLHGRDHQGQGELSVPSVALQSTTHTPCGAPLRANLFCQLLAGQFGGRLAPKLWVHLAVADANDLCDESFGERCWVKSRALLCTCHGSCSLGNATPSPHCRIIIILEWSSRRVKNLSSM